MRKRSRQEEMDKYWFEFIAWANEVREEHQYKGWDIAKQWEETKQSEFKTYDSATGDPHGKTATKTDTMQHCVLAVNEQNFWRWYVEHSGHAPAELSEEKQCQKITK